MMGYNIGAYFSSCRLNTTVCWTVLQLALVNNKENIQGSRYWPFVTRIDQWLVDFPHKDQCITESFPCHPHWFATFLKPFPWHPRGVRMASWLPHGFCIASAWLPNDPDDSRQLPDQLHVGSSLAPNVFDTVSVLCGRFPKHSRSCPQRGSLQDRLRKMRKHWR